VARVGAAIDDAAERAVEDVLQDRVLTESTAAHVAAERERLDPVAAQSRAVGQAPGDAAIDRRHHRAMPVAAHPADAAEEVHGADRRVHLMDREVPGLPTVDAAPDEAAAAGDVDGVGRL